MANAKQVMDFRPSKGITTAQSNEHQRRWTEKGWEHAVSVGNYDPTREHLNFEIKGGKVCPIDKARSIPHGGQFHFWRFTGTYAGNCFWRPDGKS